MISCALFCLCRYVAHRLSDGALFATNLTETAPSVPLHLHTVFDFEIVTFAPVLPFPESTITAEDSTICENPATATATATATPWVAAIGAVGMYNPGGSVLNMEATSVPSPLQQSGVCLRVHLELLGTGRYLLVRKLVLANEQTPPYPHYVTVLFSPQVSSSPHVVLESAEALNPGTDQQPSTTTVRVTVRVSPAESFEPSDEEPVRENNRIYRIELTVEAILADPAAESRRLSTPIPVRAEDEDRGAVLSLLLCEIP